MEIEGLMMLGVGAGEANLPCLPRKIGSRCRVFGHQSSVVHLLQKRVVGRDVLILSM